MQNSEWKRLVMGLMSLNDDKGRIEELQAVLNKIKETSGN